MKFSSQIANCNLEPIGFKLAVDNGLALEKIDSLIFLYRCFLQAILENPNIPIVPSREIDDVWHCHLLDTKAYRDDCQAIFGRFVDHFPYSGMRGKEDAEMQRERFRVSQAIINEIANRNE